MSARRTLLLLSGPNLGRLGRRQPEVYGDQTLDQHAAAASDAAARRDAALEHVQSDEEAELVRAVHAATGRHCAIVVNAAAFTHSSWALHDALAAYDGVVVELHLSNPDRREPWRHTSVVTPVAHGVVAGFGGRGYAMAVEGALDLVDARGA